MKLLAEKGADPNLVDKAGRSALIWAVERNELPLLRLLIAHDADVNIQDTEKRDALEFALELRHTAFVKLLLKKGASTANGRKRAHRLLVLVCETGDEELLETLVERGVTLLDKDELGRNIVMRAYLAGNHRLAKKLVESYSFKNHINFADKRGDSLLMMAVRAEDPDMVRFLLEACDNLLLDQRNAQGQTPLLMACELNLEQIAMLLIPRMNSTLLNMSDDVRSFDQQHKHTALLWAVKHNSLLLIAALLECGDLDTTCRDALEQTPYDHAASDLVRHLIFQHQLKNRGNDIELKVSRGRLL